MAQRRSDVNGQSSDNTTKSTKCTRAAASAIALSGPTMAGTGISQNMRNGILAAELTIHPVTGMRRATARRGGHDLPARHVAPGSACRQAGQGAGLAHRHATRTIISARITMPVDLCQTKRSSFVGESRQLTASPAQRDLHEYERRNRPVQQLGRRAPGPPGVAQHPAAPASGAGALPPGHSARTRWTDCTQTEPSPTADATRFTLPARTSPTAKTPGRLVSNG